VARKQGQEVGIAQIRQGLAACQAAEVESFRPNSAGPAAEPMSFCRGVRGGLPGGRGAGQVEKTEEERCWEAEIYRSRAMLLGRRGPFPTTHEGIQDASH